MSKKGRPPIYKTAAALKEAVDKYFETEEGPPTISGLSYYLGYESRLTFTRQLDRGPDFAEVVQYARLRCEEYAERRLYDRDGFRGAAFILACCYGWCRDNAHAQPGLPDVNVIVREPAGAEDQTESRPAVHGTDIRLMN